MARDYDDRLTECPKCEGTKFYGPVINSTGNALRFNCTTCGYEYTTLTKDQVPEGLSTLPRGTSPKDEPQ